MTPFPEGEDMTVKRLYVALKRGDEQLLKMGAHKLHEKYHSGFEFKMHDDLRDILKRLEEQKVPNDIKDLLIRTITNILNGVKPEYGSQSVQNVNPVMPQIQPQPAIMQAQPVTTPIQQALPEQTQATIQIPSQNQTIQTPLGPIQAQTTGTASDAIQLTPACPQTDFAPYGREENFDGTMTEYETPASYLSPAKDIVVFYDDKAGFIDFDKIRAYRLDIEECKLNRDSNPINNASQVKSVVDTRADELEDVLRSLKNIRGNIDLITTSKSANVLGTLKELEIKFNVINTGKRSIDTKMTVYPLFGLSNIFLCPKCGKKEYFIDNENKVLSLQCSACSASMYPDIYEAKDLETNTTPVSWLKSLNAMAKTGVWILINPPLESSRALTCEFLRTAFNICRPKKVCIVSKDTAIKEYYRQMLREIIPNCEIKSEFANADMLLTEVTKEATLQAV